MTTASRSNTMRGGRAKQPLCALTALVLLLVVLPTSCRSGGSSPGVGPLFDPTYMGSRIGFTVDPNVPFSWAYTTVVNSTNSSVTLSQAELISPTSGLSTLSTWIAPPGHGGQLRVNSPTFKRLPFMAPLAGATLQPGGASILILEMEVPANGAYSANGISLDYSTGGSAFRVSYPDKIRVCAPTSLTKPCGTSDNASPS
jgi:hypothetical protein